MKHATQRNPRLASGNRFRGLEDLWRLADQTRQKFVGGEVHLRGLIELSNHCVRLCGYCGFGRAISACTATACRMTKSWSAWRKAVEFGYGTVVLQSGEDPELTCQRIAGLVRRIKADTPLAVTLSLGERDDEELAAWREAGADRYLLRFETSNRTLYERIHPPRTKEQRQRRSAHQEHGLPHRMAILATLARLGYEVGSGVMIGIPGQTYDDLADDIEWFGRLDLDMIGVGPYLPHPNTPLADRDAWPPAADGQQVPATEEMTYKVIALARLVCPRANIPATTALATLNRQRGAGIGASARGQRLDAQPHAARNIAPCTKSIPTKRVLPKPARRAIIVLSGRIEALGRQVGQGRGDSPNRRTRLAADGTSARPGVD